MLKSQIQLSHYDRCQSQRPKEFKQCRPFQIYQSALGFRRFFGFRAGKPFHNKDSANQFLHYFNSCHRNIKFTIEFEQNNAIQFLDILVTRNQNNTFMTSIHRKKTFTGLYTKWDSFTPRKYKINLIRSLTYRYYRLCSSGSLLQSALNDLRKLLLQNRQPTTVADPDLELRGGGLDLLALSAIFPSVISSFFTQNKGGPGPPGPLP